MSKPKPERIQKVLARQGVDSRRGIEALISEGRIKVNGRIAELGQLLMPKDRVRIDGKTVNVVKPHDNRTILYNKPAGEMCTRDDPEGRPTVFDNLPPLQEQRWISIGRLDFNTTGLLIFTTDGEFANQMMHPSAEVEREYSVRVYGDVDRDMLERLRTGVKLEDGYAKFDTIREGGGKGRNRWFHVIVKQGRHRVVRRLWESQGVTVSRLMRVRFGEIELPTYLKEGEYTEY